MTAKTTRPAGRRKELHVPTVEGESRDVLAARIAVNPIFANAGTAQTFQEGQWGELSLTECAAVFRKAATAVRSGDLGFAEDTLVAQAKTLDAIFNEMARRAACNADDYLEATEIYLRLALKAQTQCRATLQTLADIKNPRPVAFVRQANIATGPQQVNNGRDCEHVATRGENSEMQPSKLLERGTNGEWMDAGAPGETGGNDPAMATVGAIDRPKD